VLRAEASTHIAAPPQRVFELITDVTRMGDWSPITYKCEWLDGATAAAVGAKFKGYNKLSPARWWTVCEVTAADPGRLFEFVTVDVSAPFSIGVKTPREMTRWRYEFAPENGGTRVTESYRVHLTPPLLRVPEQIARKLGAGRAMDRRREKTNNGMQETLRRLKEAAER
jgi:uncharacterized protein YndB with AHSA1/START domain